VTLQRSGTSRVINLNVVRVPIMREVRRSLIIPGVKESHTFNDKKVECALS
jgi:hypothetical protein